MCLILTGVSVKNLSHTLPICQTNQFSESRWKVYSSGLNFLRTITYRMANPPFILLQHDVLEPQLAGHYQIHSQIKYSFHYCLYCLYRFRTVLSIGQVVGQRDLGFGLATEDRRAVGSFKELAQILVVQWQGHIVCCYQLYSRSKQLSIDDQSFNFLDLPPLAQKHTKPLCLPPPTKKHMSANQRGKMCGEGCRVKIRGIRDKGSGLDLAIAQQINKELFMEQQGHNLNDYNFRINTQKLQHEFQCTICLNPINDCYITRCGHVYCRVCIEQSVARHHRCPFCNQELKDFKLDVFKNYHFNTLKKIIDDEKKKENQKYLNKVFEKLAKYREDKEGENKLMEPIEQSIIAKCEEALLKYRQYMLELYNSMKDVEEKKLLLGSSEIKNNHQIIKELQLTIINSLPSPVISPEIINLSTQIEVILPNKKTFKSTLKVAPIAPLSSILPFLENVCSQMNAKIKGSIPTELIINGQKRNLQQKIGMLSGKKIRVEGIPIEINVYCFTYGWQKNKVTNFFNCKECSIKWICENCSLLCHKDHTCILQLKDHKADWACCYCATKCNCQAINKNSIIK